MAGGSSERLSPLSTPAATKLVLEAHGLTAKYTFGQNFLVNDDVLRKIVALADVQPDDRVLEVGPGLGTLTIALLKHAASVVAVERDPDLPAVLADTLAPWWEKFALIQKDALDVTEGDLIAAAMVERRGDAGCADRASLPKGTTRFARSPHATENVQWTFSPSEDCLSESRYPASPTGEDSLPNKLVANLPYAVAATVVLDYFQKFPSLQSATVMVQKEVADRMAAQVGTKNYGAYTVKLGLYARPAGRFTVGPGNFFPPPRVDSAVIRLDRAVPLLADGRPAGPEEVAAACIMADAAFANRRKTLANSCKAYFAGRPVVMLPAPPSEGEAPSPARQLSGAQVAAQLPQLFEQAGIDSKRRGETLGQQEFLALGRALLNLR